MSNFWTHTIWYILLGISTVIEVIYFMLKTDKRKLVFAFYLTVTGIVFTFEAVIYVYFKSYMYYPMIIKRFVIPDVQATQLMIRYYDGIIGNMFSQFSVAATALLIVVLKLRKYWYLIFAGIYGGIEELFIYLGIYEQYWYRTWMTIVGLIILFWITEKLYYKALKGMGSVLKYLTVFMGVFALELLFKAVPIVVWDVHYNIYILSDRASSSGTIFIVEVVLSCILIMIAYFLKYKWQGNALIILILATAYYVAWKFNYVYVNVNEYWFLAISSGSILQAYLFVFIMDRSYNHKRNSFTIKNRKLQSVKE